MDMSYALTGPVPVEAHLLQGCCLEAERAGVTALNLDGLRITLRETFQAHILAVIAEIRRCSTHLRDLADRAQVHIVRVQIVLDYLNIVLPCLSKSLRDIAAYIEDKTIPKEMRWRKMCHEMSSEATGLTLPERFGLYNSFLISLKQLLTRSPNFDLNLLDALRNRILQLREQRGIPPPPLQVGPVLDRQALILAPLAKERHVHWAKKIFSIPLPSRTPLPHLRPSKSYPPHFALGAISFTPGSETLFKRSFDNDKISLQVVINPHDESSHLLIRTYYEDGSAWFSCRGAHQLVIKREGSALHLKRWSETQQRSVSWALLYFLTWEEMVLFHSTFLSLKAYHPLTQKISPADKTLSLEVRQFAARITDDRLQHLLAVYEDQLTGGIRLHASVWEGELRQSPVWTAFITPELRTQGTSSKWMTRKSKHQIWLKNVPVYVFCAKYRQENMRRKEGAFEIWFNTEEAAANFLNVFAGFTPEPSKANIRRTNSKGKGVARD